MCYRPPQLRLEKATAWLLARKKLTASSGAVLYRVCGPGRMFFSETAIAIYRLLGRRGRRLPGAVRRAAHLRRGHHHHRVGSDHHVDRVAVLVLGGDNERAGDDLHIGEALLLQLLLDLLRYSLRSLVRRLRRRAS